VAEVVAPFDGRWVGTAYDVANTLAFEPHEEGLREVGDRLRVVHVSGSWRGRWAHTSVRDGDIDFAAVARTLGETGFAGPTVYELTDGDDPEPRLRADLPLLREWGWSEALDAVR
jgi:sugar phosphate isomerase/epimerase